MTRAFQLCGEPTTSTLRCQDEGVSICIIHEVKGVNRVCLDISGKKPSMIVEVTSKG